MLQVTKKNYEKIVEKSGKPVILDFYADWCGPCQKFGPVFEEIIEANKDKVIGAKVNIEEASELAEEFGVMSIPCIIFFRDGKEVNRVSGAISAEALKEKVKEFLS